jgi:hypothetical protein
MQDNTTGRPAKAAETPVSAEQAQEQLHMEGEQILKFTQTAAC